MNQHPSVLDQRLQEFRKKYYKDKIIRGTLLLVLLMSTILFVVLLSEGLFGFSSSVRTGIVAGLGLTFFGVFAYMVFWPLSQLFNWLPTISDFQIAKMVRKHFPEINDKLINVLQLRKQDTSHALVAAAINKKEADIAPVKLSKAINLNLNNKYLKYLAIPVVLFLFTYFANPALITGSSHRLINYDKAFVPPAPFSIQIESVPTEMVAGQDYELKVQVVANKELPADLFIFMKKQSESQFIDYNLAKKSATEFSYTLTDVKEDFSFFIGNPEVQSETFAIDVLRRPFIKQFRVTIDNPAYTGLGREVLDYNVGDFKVLKGSRVSWELQPNGEIESAQFIAGDSLSFKKGNQGKYTLRKRLMKELEYFISLYSEDEIYNIDTVHYRVNILQDRFPSIYVFSPNNDFLVDLDPNMILELEIADDFGFSNMSLFYRFTKSGGTSEVNEEYKEYELGITNDLLLQPLSYNIDLTQLGLREGDELEYFIKVWDNDGVSGPKASTSGTFKVMYPTLDEKYDEITENQEEVKEDLQDLQEKAKNLQDSYKKLQEKLLDKKRLSFDDKKEVEELINEHQNMMEELSQAQEKFESTKDDLQENQMISEQTLEKYDELNRFLEDLKNPEIEKMLQELQDKMENLKPEDVKTKLDQLEMNDEEMQKALERTLELMKQLEVEQKVDELRNKIDNLQMKQELLNEQLEESETSEELEKNADRQDDLNKQMEDIQKDLDDLKDLKDDTKTPDQDLMEKLSEEGENVQEEMQEASESAEEASEKMQEQGKKNQKASDQAKQKASESQKNSSKKLQEMSNQLSSMQSNMQMQQDQQNLDDLRDLLENLLKLSFDQEDLRDDVKELKYGDPSLRDKSQTQKKLQDDMSLVKDSLESLANRVFQIKKMVLDESRNITENMQRSQTFFRNKNVTMINYHQSEAMTSVNNLANMLSETMKQIQQNMMQQQQGQGMCEKPGGNNPNMQQMGEKQQQLNQQMQQMMNAKNMSPEKLAEMAAKQEAIRQQLKEAHEKMKQEGGKALGDMEKVMDDMIQSETELLNRQLTHETMLRQQQILNRLLQADKSVREREYDNKRESKTGRELDKVSPEELSLEEYKRRLRQELLKSNKLEYSNDFIILIEQYYKKLEGANEQR